MKEVDTNGLPPEARDAVTLEVAYQQNIDRDLCRLYRRLDDRLQSEGKWQYIGPAREPEGYVLRDGDHHGHALLRERDAIQLKIDDRFLLLLRESTLIAWARVGSPIAEWSEIPASAWLHLQLGELEGGVVEGPNAILFDVRIGPKVKPSVSTKLPPRRKAGRPTSRSLYAAEARRRIEAGEAEDTGVRESEWLCLWFKDNHPGLGQLTPKTVQDIVSKERKRITIEKPESG